jgi:uncharacterized membrane protein
MFVIQIKRNNSKKNAVKAGFAGAVIGAAGAAIGMSLKDKKNREKLQKTLTDAKKWTQETVNNMQKESEDAVKSVKKEVKDSKNKVESQTKK